MSALRLTVWRTGDNWTLHVSWPDDSWTRFDGCSYESVWGEVHEAMISYRDEAAAVSAREETKP